MQQSPQEFGSLLTYLRRYSLSALLGIATEADDDGAAANGRESKLAHTFDPAPPPAPDLKQQLIRSIALEGGKPKGITALRGKLNQLAADLKDIHTEDEYYGLRRSYADAIADCEVKLPSWWVGNADQKGLKQALAEKFDEVRGM